MPERHQKICRTRFVCHFFGRNIMRPLYIKLTNFTGIKSGAGKNEIELDFRMIVPQDAKIVALSGPNGAGKTTIMDNLHPYRVMPSRSANPTPGSFSFYDHINGGQGEKVLDWEHQGVTYRSHLKFKATAKTKKTEAYLFVFQGEKMFPWSMDGNVSDGKAETYDRAIEVILGKPEVFFTAQFSAQGKQPIGKMTATEVKSLLGQMLGMEKISALGAKAQAVVKELKPHLNQVNEAIAKMQLQAGTAQLAEKLSELNVCSVNQKKEMEALRIERDEAVAKIGLIKSDMTRNEIIASERAAIESQLTQVEVRKAQEANSLHDARNQKMNDVTAQKAQLHSSNDSVSRQALALESRIPSMKALAGKIDAIKIAEERLSSLGEKKELLLGLLEEKKPSLEKLDGIRQSLSGLQQELARMESGGKHLAESLDKVRKTAALLEEVPCKGTAMAGSCRLLAHANDAQKQVVVYQDKLSGARTAYKEEKSKADCLKSSLDSLLADEAEVKAANKKHLEVVKAINECSVLLAEKGFVEQAIGDLPAAVNDLAQLQDQMQELKLQIDSLDEKVAAISGEYDSSAVELEGRFQLEKARLKNILENLPKPVGEADLLQAQQNLRQIEEREVKNQEAQDNLANAIQKLQSQIDRASEAEDELMLLQQRKDHIGNKIAQWILLSKALGTDGIIAMQIDDAGPAISNIANQLLMDCYGGRFQINLVTTAETAAGIQKEAFLIQVEDTARGESKLLDAMSGGEKVWINECLVRAIALHIAQIADTKYHTLFSDESDGALDPARKRQYMQMKREVLERGGYSREYLITQTPELLSLCDAVIDVTSV